MNRQLRKKRPDKFFKLSEGKSFPGLPNALLRIEALYATPNLPLLSYINSKEVIFSRGNGYPFSKEREGWPLNVGEAVKARILELCQERNITINKLSSLSGVTQSTVNNIVSGRNRSTTISTIKKLCDGLGITIEEFFHSELFRDLDQEIE